MKLAIDAADSAMRRNMKGRRNADAFFRRWEIDRAGLEAMVLRGLPSSVSAYYVSSIPRGLGGSTSDIDLLLITDDAAEQETSVSRMLFFAGRRVGAKVLVRAEIAASFALVEADLAAWDRNQVFPSGRLPIKWMDLERVVNGTSFDHDPEYADQLPTLSAWATLLFFEAAAGNAHLHLLAAQASQPGAAYAYGQATLMAAMDCIMASRGDFQYNMKWILERWRRFCADGPSTANRSLVEALTEARKRLECTPGDPSGSATALSALIGALRAEVLGAQPEPPTLALGAEVTVNNFLPGASVLQTDGRAVVVRHEILDNLLQVGPSQGMMSQALAAAALTLLQGGYLRILQGGPRHD